MRGAHGELEWARFFFFFFFFWKRDDIGYVRSCSRDVLGGRDVLELELKLKLET